MRFAVTSPRTLFSRKGVKQDGMAGLVLGVQGLPDGLANGLLAGVNPVAGLYGYLFGLVGGVLFTSTTFMAVQGTGAMAIIVADVGLGDRDDPARSLFTLSIVTGLVMIAAGALRLGRLLRFVSNSVMTGFITAVGINIVLGQLDNLTGYDSSGANRLTRTLDLGLHLTAVDLPSVIVGVLTIGSIVALRRTRLGPLGFVTSVVIGSAAAVVLDAVWHGPAVVGDVADVPHSLPLPGLPAFGEMPSLLLPAASLAFVGLIQGAGVAASLTNPGGRPSDASQDFVGQGAGNIVSGLFHGVPVGGSMSASSLAVSAGAQSRGALLIGAAVMATAVVALADLVEMIAMPALAGLLIVVGAATVKPMKALAVARTGPVPMTVMGITFVLTLLIPLQYSVLVGVGISVLMFVIGQSSRLVTRRLVLRGDGRVVETVPPVHLPAGEVVVLQPYGPIFFATASVLHRQMPTVTPASRHAVVILRLRGTDDAGATLLDVLRSYSRALGEVDSRLVVVTDNDRVVAQLRDQRVVPPDAVYRGTAVIGEASRRAYDDARAWIQDRTETQAIRLPETPRAARPVRDDPHFGDVPPDQLAP
jgi:SulP family sulfate permease